MRELELTLPSLGSQLEEKTECFDVLFKMLKNDCWMRESERTKTKDQQLDPETTIEGLARIKVASELIKKTSVETLKQEKFSNLFLSKLIDNDEDI